MTIRNLPPSGCMQGMGNAVRRLGASLHTARRLALALLLLLASQYAVAARVCYDAAAGTLAGVTVTKVGTGCGSLAYTGTGIGNNTSGNMLFLDAGQTLGNTQSCTLNFSVPVKNVTIDIGAHTCADGACEKASFSINGVQRPITSGDLVTPDSDLINIDMGTAAPISIDAATGDLLGGDEPSEGSGNGTGRLTFSESSVSSIKITQTTIANPNVQNFIANSSPEGTLYKVCYDGLAVAAPTLTVKKISTGAAGAFSFKGTTANANGFSTDNSYTVTTTAAGTVATGSAVTLTAANTVTEIQEAVPPGWVLTGASCVDNNAATTGNLAGTFGVLNGTTLQLPAATVLGGADLQCTFYNTFVGQGISGKVLLDTGAGSGSAHDAIQNGSELGHAGVSVSLTNCSGTTYSTTTTAGDGSFLLGLTGVPANQAVCVVQSLPSGYGPVSVNAGTTPSATTTTTANSTTLKFTPAANTAYSGIVLGNAPVSTLTSDGAQQTVGGQTVTYAHIYTAGSAGSVTFSTASTSTPANAPWSATVFVDANCNSKLDAGETAPSAAMAVTAGQQVCLINRVFTPAGLSAGAQDSTVVRATQSWSTPTLSATTQSQVLQNTDTTTVSSVGLNLIKEVRKLASCPATAAASEAIGTAYGSVSSAKPGDALEYRLRYSNNASSPINSVKLYDAVPAYTLFKSAYCLTTPTQGITGCTVTQQPATNAITGSVAWSLTDASGPYAGLQPSDSGSVGFCITVQTN